MDFTCVSLTNQNLLSFLKFKVFFPFIYMAIIILLAIMVTVFNLLCHRPICNTFLLKIGFVSKKKPGLALIYSLMKDSNIRCYSILLNLCYACYALKSTVECSWVDEYKDVTCMWHDHTLSTHCCCPLYTAKI